MFFSLQYDVPAISGSRYREVPVWTIPVSQTKYLRPRVLVLDELGYLPNGISSRKQPKTSYLSMLAMVLCMFGLF